MSFEAEVIPLFIGGVAIVSALELIAGCVLLRNLREARNRLIAHTVCIYRISFSHKTGKITAKV